MADGCCPLTPGTLGEARFGGAKFTEEEFVGDADGGGGGCDELKPRPLSHAQIVGSFQRRSAHPANQRSTVATGQRVSHRPGTLRAVEARGLRGSCHDAENVAQFHAPRSNASRLNVSRAQRPPLHRRAPHFDFYLAPSPPLLKLNRQGRPESRVPQVIWVSHSLRSNEWARHPSAQLSSFHREDPGVLRGEVEGAGCHR